MESHTISSSSVNTITRSKEFKIKDETILKYDIKYPEFENPKYMDEIEMVNAYYANKTMHYLRYDVQNLYRLALEDYKYAKENDIPYRSYEVYSEYTVTYDKECYISTYTDTYQYTGGAHGSTIRDSVTWNLSRETKMSLTDFFQFPEEYEEEIGSQIIAYITADIAAGNDIYFEDYRTNVKDNLKKDSFYLTEEGIVIYFQQYDIAPYSSGILTFLIPFEEGRVVLPNC